MSSIEHGVEPKKVYINSTLIFFVIHRLSEKITSIKRGWSSFCQYLKKGIEPVHNLGLSHFLASLNRGSKWKIVPLDEKWICTNLILATIPHICKNWGVNLSKDVKCHICLVIYTALFFGMQMSHLPSLPHIYSSGFYKFAAYLQGANLCKSI